MKKSCREIIQEILTKAAENNQTLTESEFIELLDKTPGFWEQAKEEGFTIENPNKGLAK